MGWHPSTLHPAGEGAELCVAASGNGRRKQTKAVHNYWKEQTRMPRTADKHGTAVGRGAPHDNCSSIVVSSSQCRSAHPAANRANFLVVEGTGRLAVAVAGSWFEVFLTSTPADPLTLALTLAT